jgi:hypothetical protein
LGHNLCGVHPRFKRFKRQEKGDLDSEDPESVKAAFNAVPDDRGATLQLKPEKFTMNWNVSDEKMIWSPLDASGVPP